ncbi:MlaD family protein [Thiopseudomonas alkaliphila]|uniref:MlaD family protein n=1 Tax=Thiopseudomonas alkaliphila TaxID=1697053 RepID=UPI002577DF4A|nr:MlaD family protein [Thiopseudomonas alkaliphila]MDM1707466.1 MCE family protein [Thiopseudomonas alkaliphila]
MSDSRKPFLIGAFVLAGIFLLVSGVMILSRDSLFTKPAEYVVYFTGTLDGLDVGADVTYRGVKVGSVREIRLSYDRSIQDVIMPVVIRINQGENEAASLGGKGFDAVVEPLVERGLRAQLQTPSLLTGKAIVALDFFPGQQGYIREPHRFDAPAIPSVPSKIDQAADVLRDLVAGLKDVPIAKLMDTASGAMRSLDKLASSPALTEGMAGINKILANVDQLTAQLNLDMPQLMGSVTGSGNELTEVMKELRQTAKNTQLVIEQMNGLVVDSRRSIGPQSELQYEMLNALQELSQASKAMQRAAEGLERNPESLIFGKKQ